MIDENIKGVRVGFGVGPIVDMDLIEHFRTFWRHERLKTKDNIVHNFFLCDRI